MENNTDNTDALDQIKTILDNSEGEQLTTALGIINAEVKKRGRPRKEKAAKIATVRGLKIALSRAANQNSSKINEIVVNEQEKTVKFSATGGIEVQQAFQSIISKNGYSLTQ